jgi:hypothetical protein
MSFDRQYEIEQARRDQAKQEDRPLLEPGMLIVDPDYNGRPQLWTVSKVAKRSTTLLAHYGTCYAEAKFNAVTLPENWKILNGESLAREAVTA